MYYTALHGLAPLGLRQEIVLGNEISPEILRQYETHVLEHVLPALKRAKVSAVVADGHSKVHIKCASALAHAGKPCKDRDGKAKPYGHGWFMEVSPDDRLILWAKPMCKPEENDSLDEAINYILPMYRNLDGVVVDRACGFLKRAQECR